MSRALVHAPADRALERALLLAVVVHAAALAAALALLWPALPWSACADGAAARVAYVAAHPWRLRAGCVPWPLCALADLLLAGAMVRVRWIPRGATVVALALTACAVVPDQLAVLRWLARGVALARTDRAAYLALERDLPLHAAAPGALLRALAGLAWTYGLARAGTWSRPLALLSVPLWTATLALALAPLAPASLRPGPQALLPLATLASALLLPWLALVAELVLRRARPFEPYGRLARWRHPSPSILSRALDAIANSRLLGALLEPLPEFAMVSEITDVVYVNYLVAAERLAKLVPEGLELQRLGPKGEHALFTFLTFRHGHFRVRALGALRRLFPSPVQTNWRIHVRDPRSGLRGIYFVTNAVTHPLVALGARLATEGMPMHVLSDATLARAPDGAIRLRLDPGSGTAPDADAALHPADAPALTGAWRECWTDFASFLAYCVPQDRALSSQPLRGRISAQEIDLGIPLSACEPLAGTVMSRAADAIAGDAAPLAFRVPAVTFRFAIEAHHPMAPAGPSDEAA